MTGESDSSHSPVVLKIPKSIWLRATANSSGNSSKSSSDIRAIGEGHRECDTLNCKDCLLASIESLSAALSKAKKRIQKPLEKSGAVLELLRSILQQLSSEQKQSLVQINPREYLSNALGSLSYEEVAGHIGALRLELVSRQIRPILQKLFFHPKNNNLFNAPVDAAGLGLADYSERVASPMDLGTVKSRLQQGVYSSLQQCADDIALVFRNALSYNPEGHPIHVVAKLLQEEFEAEMKLVYERNEKEEERRLLHDCSVCSGEACLLCGEKCLRFESPVLVCHGSCGQRVKKNAVFFISRDAGDVYCQRCYGNLSSAIAPERGLFKRDMLKRRVDEEVWEPWVSCDACGGWVHRVCALVSDREPLPADAPFACPLCRLQALVAPQLQPQQQPPQVGAAVAGQVRTSSRRAHRPLSDAASLTDSPSASTDNESDGLVGALDAELERDPVPAEAAQGDKDVPISAAIPDPSASPLSHWRAAALPRTRLSDFIETVLGDRLAALGFSPALMQSLTVRVTSNTEDTLWLPAPIVNNFVSAEGALLSAALPYRQKSILLFQRADGVDLCLFSLYVQEFDAACPAPNTSKVYVAYLDSVEYLAPREARTCVYHEVMVAYLKWAQTRGFESAHIWACPPQRGDNFIFWCHPSWQRTPSRERLNNWYALMLRRCEQLGVASEVSNLWNTHFAQHGRRRQQKQQDSQRPRPGSSSTTATVAVSQAPSTEQPMCPPVFEGDFWVLECLRLHRLVMARAAGEVAGAAERAAHCRLARDLLKELSASPGAHLFAAPVDPVLLNIPSYREVVARPMDLGSVRTKLRLNQYSSLLALARDVRLVFENALLFNPPGHFVNTVAAAMLQAFNARLVRVARERGGGHVDEAASAPEEMAVAVDAVLETLQLCPPAAESGTFVPAPTLQRAQSGSSEQAAALEQEGCGALSRGVSLELDGCSVAGAGERHEDDALHWARRSFFSSAAASASSPQYRTSVERSELGGKGTAALMTDLCRSILRLKEDLFVVTLVKPGSAPHKRPRPSLPEDEALAFAAVLAVDDAAVLPEPVAAAGKQRSKLPAHLAKCARRAPVNFYAVPSCAHEGEFSAAALALLRDVRPDTSDPDVLRSCALVSTRHTFLEMCQFRHYQFDTLRRAKHSSLMLLYHLHRADPDRNPAACEQLRPQCSSCLRPISDLRWHCDQCVDVDLCDACATGPANADPAGGGGDGGKSQAHEHPLTPFRVTYR